MRAFFFTKYTAIFFISIVLFIWTTGVVAQVGNGSEEKPIGCEYSPNGGNQGSPFFMNEWTKATLYFESGKSSTNLPIKYDGYQDELVYYNATSNSQIKIDKSTIVSFCFSIGERKIVFEKRTFSGFLTEEQFFQVFYKGSVDLLCWRKVELGSDQAGASGRLLFNQAPKFYLQNANMGIKSIKLSPNSLLKLITKDQRKMVRKVIRINNLKFKDPDSFAYSLKIIDSNLKTNWKD